MASRSGKVTWSGPDPAWPGRGNYVVVECADGMIAYYMHLSLVLISEGEYVSQGYMIGDSGATGWATGPDLHFGIRDPRENMNEHLGFIDPAALLA